MIFRKKTALEKLRKGEVEFMDLPRRFRGDREVVLEAVKKYGLALKYASEEFRNDREVVLEAVKKDGLAFKYASEDLQNDIEVISTAVNNTPRYIPLHAEPGSSVNLLITSYFSQLYKNPELYKDLPTWYFRDENAEDLAEINSKIGQALKDRVGEKVSEEDELYATNILTMMNETIREKRQEIAKEEAQKLEAQEQKEKDSKKVEGYKDSIDSQIANLGKGE